MGANHSREDLELLESETESETGSESRSHDSRRDDDDDEENYEDASTPSSFQPKTPAKTPTSLDDVEAKLKALKLKYNVGSQHNPTKNAVKLYLHVGGNTPKSKWVVADKLTTYCFVKSGDGDEDEEDEECEDGWWVLKIGSKIKAKVDENLQLKAFKDQKRIDFVADGVWAAKFFDEEEYTAFFDRYKDCLFENTYGYEANDANRVKVYGKDFIGWAKPELADDSMWEDAGDSFFKSPSSAKTPLRESHDLREEFEEAAANGGAIQSLALGALDNSFLISDSGIQVVRNYNHGIQGKGVYVNFDKERFSAAHSTPRKALLMRAETNMLLMSPVTGNTPHPRGLHQLDIETGKVVSEWRFEKDGVDISMRDITNDSKGAQMDPSGSTFLGLDDNRLCRWDMRDRNGMVQNLVNESTPVLNWTQGHQFSRGTNFQCFATTGDGSIVVGSIDGKIRLYSSNTMRQAKTAFPGLGSPITHVDVTYDGKWILGTTDNYLVLICTLFTDKDGKTKTGFAGRMGNRISAPRLLKLTPLDSHIAGANNRFQKAQFSWVTENGKQERHLVATVGKFSVIWNFQQVKDGAHQCYQSQVGLKSCYCYKIVLRDESIIDSRFMHDKFAVTDSPEAPLVVATPLKVSSFSISSRRLNL
nr:protein CYPRO4 [Ipomoea batatas]